MFSDKLFETNYKLFANAKPEIKNINVVDAKAIRDADYKNLKAGQRWPLGESLIKSAITIPRSDQVKEIYEEECADFCLGEGTSQYDDVPGGDPHLLQPIIALAEYVNEKCEISIEEVTTNLDVANPYCIYVLATGSGIELLEYIKRFKPVKLVIAITDWVDLLSSFWHIDWREISKIYPTKKIEGKEKCMLLSRDEKGYDHMSTLNNIGMSLLDHSLIYYPTCAKERLSKSIDDLTGPALRSIVHYMGFILDEYNMVLNTAGSLPLARKLHTKKIQAPKHSNAVICGSGPSLDGTLNAIKDLSSDHSIVACASNFLSLLKAGIRVDYLVLLERGLNNYKNYKDALEKFPSPETILVCSTTCAPNLHSLFERSVVYYRPALMPTTLFSPSIDHVLHYEGPQTTNAGLAWVTSLGYENVVIAGVDLGTADQKEPRSKGALGISPRNFDAEVKGNKRDIVFSNRSLIDARRVKETCIRNSKSTNYYNFSDGVFIDGAKSGDLSSYRSIVKKQQKNVAKEVSDLYTKLPKADIASASMDWNASRFRAESYKLLRNVRSIIQLDIPFYPEMAYELEEAFKLNVPLREQTPRKLYRSAFLKLALAIRNQSIVISSHQGKEQATDFEKHGRHLMLQLVEALILELFDLSDRVDLLLSNET